jgi:hypothetical protein
VASGSPGPCPLRTMRRERPPTGASVDPSRDGRTGYKADLLGRPMRLWERRAQLRLARRTKELEPEGAASFHGRPGPGSFGRSLHRTRQIAPRTTRPAPYAMRESSRPSAPRRARRASSRDSLPRPVASASSVSDIDCQTCVGDRSRSQSAVKTSSSSRVGGARVKT